MEGSESDSRLQILSAADDRLCGFIALQVAAVMTNR